MWGRGRILALATFVVSLATAAAPASGGAAILLGPPNPNPNPGTSQAINWPDGTALFNNSAPTGVRLVAPSPGVVTRWNLYIDDAGEGSSLRLRVMSRATGDSFTMISTGPAEPVQAVTGDHDTLLSFAAHEPIIAGRTLAVQLNHPPSPGLIEPVLPVAETAPGPWAYGNFSPAPADGVTATASVFTPTMGSATQYLAFNAEVEPDADGDRFGDETQDRCLGTGGTEQGCPPGTLAPQPAVEANTSAPAASRALVLPRSVRLTRNRKRLSAVVRCLGAARCVGRLSARTARPIRLRRGRRAPKAAIHLGAARFDIAGGGRRRVAIRVRTAARRAIVRLSNLKVTLALSTSEATTTVRTRRAGSRRRR
ncbi:MAG TPA: hypothetical protein VFZ41_08400 [Solirubrobacterales bacterium]